MKFGWILILLFLVGCASKKEALMKILKSDSFYTLEKDISNNSLKKEINPSSVKITAGSAYRVGVVELSPVGDNFPYKKKVFTKEIKSEFKSSENKYSREIHSEAVIAALLLEYENIDVYLCSLENILLIDQCLSWFIDQEVIAVNISLEFDVIGKKAHNLIDELIQRKATVTHAAGNENKVSRGLCSLISGIICVGATKPGSPGIPAEFSNYGEFVTAWDDPKIVWRNEILEGSSISAPRFLGKIIKKHYIDSYKK